MKSLLAVCVILIFSACVGSAQDKSINSKKIFNKASENGALANEGFTRSYAYMKAWLGYADPKSKLTPRTLYKNDEGNDIWNAKDSAADNYPFLVLTSFFTNQQMFHGVMREMLDNEIALTSRVQSLPDTYSFSKEGFKYDTVDMDRIVFGTSEYIKDGLLPLTEWLGRSPWSERMITMLTELHEYVDVAGLSEDSDFGEAQVAEVNGELLQTLSRIYWMTGKQEFLDWAIEIGDYFLLGEGYPLTGLEYLKLRDHGNELVSGLCELYATLHFKNEEKQKTYQQPLYKLLDYILEYGRNKDGLFYNAINPQTGEVLDKALSDGWGYMLNGYYTVYMIDHVEKYKNAATRIFDSLHKYRNYDWESGGADGYADAIEGAINIFNRIPDNNAADWIDSEIQVMWSLQDSSYRENAQPYKNEGIIEGWYGDGNFARTTIMYNLWKSKGTYLQPWNPKLKLGAEMKGDTLFFVAESAKPWKGKVYFDKQRHSAQMNMPLDWTRINQFPEWYTVKPDLEYKLVEVNNESDSEKLKGAALLKNGIQIELEAGEAQRFILQTTY